MNAETMINYLNAKGKATEIDTEKFFSACISAKEKAIKTGKTQFIKLSDYRKEEK